MTNHTKVIALMCAGFLIASCSVKVEDEEAEAEYLFVQSSRAFFYDGEHLVLTGTSPYTIYFSDRPVRKAGRLPLEAAHAWGRSGPNNFLENPPNATLTFRQGDELINVVLTIADGVVRGDSISFSVDILEGQLPERGRHNALFVDGLGEGLMDLARDTVDDKFGDDDEEDEGEDDEDEGEDDEDADDASSIVEELTQLKGLLDAGLITQEDYDAKKKELLDKM